MFRLVSRTTFRPGPFIYKPLFQGSITPSFRFVQTSSTSPIETPISSASAEASKSTQHTLESLESNTKSSHAAPDLTPLRLGGDLYASLRVHGRKYLVTEGDLLYLSYNFKHGNVGDTLEFNDVVQIGSRDYTLNGDPIDSSIYSIKGVIIEKTHEPTIVKEKHRKRRRRVKRVYDNPALTVLRINELILK